MEREEELPEFKETEESEGAKVDQATKLEVEIEEEDESLGCFVFLN
jgi:hypothetical protein